jgi:hypothetical protein
VPDIHMTGRAREAVKGEVPNPIDRHRSAASIPAVEEERI